MILITFYSSDPFTGLQLTGVEMKGTAKIDQFNIFALRVVHYVLGL